MQSCLNTATGFASPDCASFSERADGTTSGVHSLRVRAPCGAGVSADVVATAAASHSDPASPGLLLLLHRSFKKVAVSGEAR